MQTEMLTPNQAGFARASTILSDGGLVAFPTETVYGLGADARNDMAVARIFEAKGRPRFNPLIVHIDSVDTARTLVQWSALADRLAAAFWPGPITLVLPLQEDAGLSALVTAGLPTLAIRVPEHPTGRALLTAFGGPVAAPSANPSGRISPTTACHVAAGLSGKIDAILDGGACGVGVESTIIGLWDTPILLRQGGLPQEAIEDALGAPVATHPAAGNDTETLTAPGQMSSHYAPNAPIRLNASTAQDHELLLGFGPVQDATLNLSPSGDLREAAANLFRHLHSLDGQNPAGIAVSPIPDHGLGRAINDRLARAAAPRP